jgi:hypothetical protein
MNKRTDLQRLEEGMKTIFRTFGFGVLMAALLAVGGVSAFGQDACGDVDAINAQYQVVLDNYKSSDIPTFQKAIEAAKTFLEKYGTCEVAKQNVDWVKKKLPTWETDLVRIKDAAAKSDVGGRFDAAIQSKNYDAAYTAGEEFITKYPNDDARMNFIVPLAWIGFQEVGNKNNKYNANAIKYAKLAIENLRSGNAKPKPSGGFGAFQFECKGKDECISFLTYAIGYITYFGDGNKQAALPYFYEATKLPGTFKTNPVVYGTIGDYYYETVRKLAEEVKAKIADQKDTDPDDVKAKKDADIKQAVGMLNGYAERAMDAYSRAYSLAKADPKGATYAANVYKSIQALYTVRFQKQDGINEWITATVAKPFPDPTSAVTPVIDNDASTNSTGGVGAASGNGVGAASGNGTGVPSGNGVGAATGNGMGNAAAAKTPAKPAKPRP